MGPMELDCTCGLLVGENYPSNQGHQMKLINFHFDHLFSDLSLDCRKILVDLIFCRWLDLALMLGS